MKTQLLTGFILLEDNKFTPVELLTLFCKCQANKPRKHFNWFAANVHRQDMHIPFSRPVDRYIR